MSKQKTTTVPTVAYGFLGPDAIRIFLQMKGYQVSVFNGDPKTLDLRRDKPARNVVVLPNFAKRTQLATVGDQLGYLVVLTNGRHEPIVEQDIPILDGHVDDQGHLQQGKAQTPSYFIEQMQAVAVPISLGPSSEQASVAAPKRATKRKTPRSTVDRWFDSINQTCYDAITDFDQQIEYPVCQFLTGELGQTDFKRAMQALVRAGGSKDTMRDFYRWLTTDQYADRMAKAMQQYLQPAHEDAAPPASAVAQQFGVDKDDVRLLDNIYQDMQQHQQPASTEGEDE